MIAPRIAVLLPDLRGGGAERMRVMLAREWLSRDFEVDFVLLRGTGKLLEVLPSGARVIDLRATRFRNAILPLRTYLRQTRPSVLLAAMWPLTVVAVIAARLSGTGVRTVLSDHNTLSESYRHRGAMHRALLRTSMALTYRLADVRIAVSRGVAGDISDLSGIRQEQFRVIYNPAASGDLDASDVAIPAELADVKGPLILTVGTLKDQKDHALLIKAFAKLAQESDATLCILGEGVLRSELEQLVIQYGLQGRVLLPGFQVETAPWYRRADLFVLSSRYEGFGNVIVEAMEHGVPVVSTDCRSGPREILCDGKYGRLVPVGDTVALANAMQASLSERPDPHSLRIRASDFSSKKIACEYLDAMFPSSRTDMAA